MQFKFVFCFKGIKVIQIIKLTITFFYDIPLNNTDSFFNARQCHRLPSDLALRPSDLAPVAKVLDRTHPSLFGIIKRITCFS